MSFLAPLFLLGGLAIGLPILFHLIRRTTREKTDFSSVMFLQPTPPRVTKRSRIENWLLLLLRCGVILLIAFGFARPFLPQSVLPATTTAPGRQMVILLDTSASMRRDGLWDAAKEEVSALLKDAKPADEIALMAFDAGARTLLTLDEWNKTPLDERRTAAEQRLATLQPGWNATHLGTALLRGAELFDKLDTTNLVIRTRQLVVVSDLQEGSRLDGLQGHEWPRGLQVVTRPVKAKRPTNLGLQWISNTDDAASAGTAPATLRLRAINATESKRDQFQLRWADAPNSEAQSIYVPAGQARVIKPPLPPAGARPESLIVSGDDATFDNTVFVVSPEPLRLPVLFFGSDAETDSGQSLYYLKRAFPPGRTEIVDIKAVKPGEPIAAFELQQAQFVVLGENPGDAAFAAARQFAESGKLVLASLSSAADLRGIGQMLGQTALAGEEAKVRDYAMLSQIDFRHPLFAPFNDPRFSDFTKIHFWKHRRVNAEAFPKAQVLARFDTGEPALLQIPVGKGALILLTTTWRPADSQLALSSKFVPLLHSLLEQSRDIPPRQPQYFIGETVALPTGSQPVTVRKPDGATVEIPAGGSFNQTDQPGVYQLSPGTGKFVVNLLPDESRTTPLPEETLASLGVPLRDPAALTAAAPEAKRLASAQAAEVEGQQKLWRWLVMAALLIVLVESWLAGRSLKAPSAEPAGA